MAATTLSIKDMRSLTYCYNSVFAKIFGVSDNNNILMCEYYCNFFSFELLYEYLRLGFLKSLIKQNILKFNDISCINDFIEYNNLIKKYKLSYSDNKSVSKQKFWNKYLTLIDS